MMEQVILVTGCSTGIGRATALLGKERGHRVFASARRRTDLAGLEERGIETVELDVTDQASVDVALGAALRATRRIDGLLNNARYRQQRAREKRTLPERRPH